jgi:Tol biopolymer transport system component
MGRILLAAFVVLALTACTTGGTPSPSTTASASAEPSVSPAATAEPSASPSATSAIPPDENAATGLAIVQFPGGNNDPASHIFVVDTDGGLLQVTGQAGESIGASRPEWSPDRSQIAFGPPKVGFPGVTGQVSVVNADGTGERVLSEGENPRWSPDGTRLLVSEVDDVTSEPRSIWIVDVATGELTDLGQGFNPQWLPDGERISFRRMVDTPDGSFADAVYIMTLATGETVEFGTQSESDVFWAPDGSSVLIAQDGELTLAEPDGSGGQPFATGFDPVWSPDSTRVLFAYDVDQQGIPLLAVVDLDGQTIWSGTAGQTPTWSPDGTRIAVEVPVPDIAVHVLDAATGEVLWEFEQTSGPDWS